MADVPPLARLPFLLLGMAALVVGVLAGLARLAVPVPAFALSHAGEHGALMVAAFFGTVISLERAVAVRRAWAYLGPMGAALGGLALLLGAPVVLAPLLCVFSAAVLTTASIGVWRQQPAVFTFTLAAGAFALLTGNLMWLAGASISAAMPLWMTFLVLTIAGERLELTRFLPARPRADVLFKLVFAVITGGAVLTALGLEQGSRLIALGLITLALWLLRYDIARKTVHQQGLTRFIAVCLLSGYVWLAVSGLLGLGGAYGGNHVYRDAALHALFIGFVFSMVIGHAPIIFPAVMRVAIPYHPAFYLPLTLLHISVLARVVGNLAWNGPLRQGAALANGAAIAIFILTLLIGVHRGRRSAMAKPR